MVISPQFDGAESFSEGLALVKVDGKRGFIDKKGTIVITPQFESALDFKDGLAKVELTKSMSGYINKKGKIVYSVRVNK